jgi:hypothetical protein
LRAGGYAAPPLMLLMTQAFAHAERLIVIWRWCCCAMLTRQARRCGRLRAPLWKSSASSWSGRRTRLMRCALAAHASKPSARR